jgi:hypothetical protein
LLLWCCWYLDDHDWRDLEQINLMPITGTLHELVRDKVKGSGVLRYVGAKALSYLPYNGNQLKINGLWRAIPDSGIAGLGNNASCFINGVAVQALAVNTFYYVYAFMNGVTMTADFSTTAYAVSTTTGNVGVTIKSGDDTRSLIGMVKTNATTDYRDTTGARLVRSWFNRDATRRDFTGTLNAGTGTNATNWVELNSAIRSYFLIWKDETAFATLISPGYNTADGGACYWSVAWDGIVASQGFNISGVSDSPINYQQNCKCASVKDGRDFSNENTDHYVTLMCFVSAGGGFIFGITSYLGALHGCLKGGE